MIPCEISSVWEFLFEMTLVYLLDDLLHYNRAPALSTLDNVHGIYYIGVRVIFWFFIDGTHR